jgi:hypothetical protein
MGYIVLLLRDVHDDVLLIAHLFTNPLIRIERNIDRPHIVIAKKQLILLLKLLEQNIEELDKYGLFVGSFLDTDAFVYLNCHAQW